MYKRYALTDEEKSQLDKYKPYYIKSLYSNLDEFVEGQTVYLYNMYSNKKSEKKFSHFEMSIYPHSLIKIFSSKEDRDGFVKFSELMDSIIDIRLFESVKEAMSKFADARDIRFSFTEGVEFVQPNEVFNEPFDLQSYISEYNKWFMPKLDESKDIIKDNQLKREELLKPKVIRYDWG